ncbi:MAG: EFR1 family ferrodoxin [Spirochaetia bacterium]|jgi:ferredoxin/flavodoxin
MTTTIYYYSATGNSLVIARAIAEALGDTQLLPVARYRKERAEPGTARVGIIFPIHAWGPPRTVEEFIQNLDLSGVRYSFAVASCGGTAAGALPKLRKALRRNGAELHAGFMVRSPGYMAGGDRNPMIEMVRKLSGKLFPTAEERLPEIIQCVRSEKRMKPDRNALPGAILGDFFHTKAGSQFAGLDASYEVSENCKSCGNCTRICPRGNVTLLDGKPTWHHDCDFCGACATWCANNAIGFKGMPPSSRKHNMQVTRADLVWA